MSGLRLLATVVAGLLGTAVAGHASAAATTDAMLDGGDLSAVNARNSIVLPLADVMACKEPEGHSIVLVDPQTGQAFAVIRVLAVLPETETEADTPGCAQPRSATANAPSVRDAIEAAERHTGGGTVLEARLKQADSADTYLLKVHQNNAIWEGRIGAGSGEVLGTDRIVLESEFDADDRAELSALGATSTTIVEAVQLAEKHARGKAISVEIEEANGGGTIWEVVVVKEDKASRVIIDPASGEVRSK